jgi:hypothetical protein
MDRDKAVSPQTHFHIRWSGVGRLAWERFDTREMAAARAEELIRPGELYMIEEFGETCARCSAKVAGAG